MCQAPSKGRLTPRLPPPGAALRSTPVRPGAPSSLRRLQPPGPRLPPPFTCCGTGVAPTRVPVAAPAPATAPATAVAAAATTTVVRAAIFPRRAARCAAAPQALGGGVRAWGEPGSAGAAGLPRAGERCRDVGRGQSAGRGGSAGRRWAAVQGGAGSGSGRGPSAGGSAGRWRARLRCALRRGCITVHVIYSLFCKKSFSPAPVP